MKGLAHLFLLSGVSGLEVAGVGGIGPQKSLGVPQVPSNVVATNPQLPELRMPSVLDIGGLKPDDISSIKLMNEVQAFRAGGLKFKEKAEWSLHSDIIDVNNVKDRQLMRSMAQRDSVYNGMYGIPRWNLAPTGEWQPTLKEAGWFAMHENLAAEAKAYKPSKPGQHKLVLFGDSLMEEWRGTDLGHYDWTGRLPQLQQVFNDTIGQRYPDALISAIWSDSYQQLWYRLHHGALSPQMANDEGLIMSMLIGSKARTTGKTRAEFNQSIDYIYDGIMNNTRYLLENTKGKLLLNGLMYAGSRVYNEQFNDVINEKIHDAVPALLKEFPRRVGYVDCTGPFGEKLNAKQQPIVGKWDTTDLMEGGKEMAMGSMVWGTHPNKKGHRVWLNCMLEALKKMETL